MAFTIGIQWLTKFTVLLRTDQDRERLVQYMKDVRKTVHLQLQTSLDLAADEGENDEEKENPSSLADRGADDPTRAVLSRPEGDALAFVIGSEPEKKNVSNLQREL